MPERYLAGVDLPSSRASNSETRCGTPMLLVYHQPDPHAHPWSYLPHAWCGVESWAHASLSQSNWVCLVTAAQQLRQVAPTNLDSLKTTDGDWCAKHSATWFRSASIARLRLVLVGGRLSTVLLAVDP